MFLALSIVAVVFLAVGITLGSERLAKKKRTRLAEARVVKPLSLPKLIVPVNEPIIFDNKAVEAVEKEKFLEDNNLAHLSMKELDNMAQALTPKATTRQHTADIKRYHRLNDKQQKYNKRIDDLAGNDAARKSYAQKAAHIKLEAKLLFDQLLEAGIDPYDDEWKDVK